MASEDAARRAGKAFAGRRGTMRQPVIGGIHTHLGVTHGESAKHLSKAEAEKHHFRLHRWENPGHSHGADL